VASEATTEQHEEATHSGRLLVRMPPSLHAELVEAARREGVSLNTFITGVLAGAIAWRAPEGAQHGRGWPRASLTVNLVAVVVLALVAVALLIVALVQA
jgi:hypothetical protein